MSDHLDIKTRWQVIDAEARKLGYIISADAAPNMPAPITHMAFAAPDRAQPTMGRFLCYSTSAIEAGEAGLATLRGIVENGEPWPEPS